MTPVLLLLAAYLLGAIPSSLVAGKLRGIDLRQHGRGVATSAGVLLALAPAAVGVGLALWTALVFLTGYVSLGSIAAAIVIPILIYFLQGSGPVLWLKMGRRRLPMTSQS